MLRRTRRTEAGEFLAEGAQAVREAIGYQTENPGTVLDLFVTEAAATRNTGLIRLAFAAGIEVTQVTDRAAAAMSDTQAPQGIVARCRTIEVDLATALAGSPKLVAVLVQTNDPGNAGTIIRLADAVGADAVVVAGDAVDPFNPKVVRASTGSLFHLPIARSDDPATLLEKLAAAGLSTLATTGGAELDLDTARSDGLLELPTAWLFGSEAHGLPAEIIAAADAAVRVPIHGRAESLNMATAAAVCLYASAGAQRG
nr:RNA methyltransferase [Nakamurella lactea]